MKNMRVDSLFEKVKRPIYIYSVLLAHLLYVLLALGIFIVDKKYIHYLNVFTQAFVAGFLIYRFHPYTKYELREDDNILLFGAGIFLLTNIGITSLIVNNITSSIKYVTKQVFSGKPQEENKQKENKNDTIIL